MYVRYSVVLLFILVFLALSKKDYSDYSGSSRLLVNMVIGLSFMNCNEAFITILCSFLVRDPNVLSYYKGAGCLICWMC